MLSVGTGLYKSAMRSDFAGEMAPGVTDWVQDIIKISLEMNTQLPILYSKCILGEQLFRLNPVLDEHLDGFDGSPDSMGKMIKVGLEVDLGPALQWLSAFWN